MANYLRFTGLFILGFLLTGINTSVFIIDQESPKSKPVYVNDPDYPNDAAPPLIPPIARVKMGKREPGFLPFISISALSNMKLFFDNLKHNFKVLENMSPAERKVLLDSYFSRKMKHGECKVQEKGNRLRAHSPPSHPTRPRMTDYQNVPRAYRPPATAAYLNAIRNSKASNKIRKFVTSSEPKYLKGSNYYNPSYLLTGLGKRQRD